MPQMCALLDFCCCPCLPTLCRSGFHSTAVGLQLRLCTGQAASGIVADVLMPDGCGRMSTAGGGDFRSDCEASKRVGGGAARVGEGREGCPGPVAQRDPDGGLQVIVVQQLHIEEGNEVRDVALHRYCSSKPPCVLQLDVCIILAACLPQDFRRS